MAVVDFLDFRGVPSDLGRFLAEEFPVALARTKKGFDLYGVPLRAKRARQTHHDRCCRHPDLIVLTMQKSRRWRT
jgi:hypothetical protein